MHVILCTVDAVYQVGDHARIFAIRREDVDVRRIGANVCGSQRFSCGAEDLQAVQSHVVSVPPGGQDVDDQPLSLRQHRDFKLLLLLHRRLVIRAITQMSLSVQSGKRAPGSRGWVDWKRGWTAALTLHELVKDVALKAHVGDASTLTLVELDE